MRTSTLSSKLLTYQSTNTNNIEPSSLPNSHALYANLLLFTPLSCISSTSVISPILFLLLIPSLMWRYMMASLILLRNAFRCRTKAVQCAMHVRSTKRVLGVVGDVESVAGSSTSTVFSRWWSGCSGGRSVKCSIECCSWSFLNSKYGWNGIGRTFSGS